MLRLRPRRLGLRPALALALGAALPLALDAAAEALLGEPWRPGPPAVWVADRDGGRVVALDRALYRTAACELVAPVAVAARADGGAWAVDAVERDPAGRLAVVRVAPDGRRVAAVPLVERGAVDLAAAEGSALVCVAGAEPAAAAVLAVAADGAVAWRRAGDGARCVAGRGTRVLIGARGGALLLLDRASGGALLARRELGGDVLDVAPAPRGGWWALAREGERRRVLLLAGDLGTRWESAVASSAPALAAAPAGADAPEGAVWLAAARRAAARRLVPFAPVAPERTGLPLRDLGAPAATPQGGVWLPGPGAVLELDARGRPVQSQGGFERLTAASAVPPR